jgi:hypothetical protein
MKESYGEGVAIHPGPESCTLARKGLGEGRINWSVNIDSGHPDGLPHGPDRRTGPQHFPEPLPPPPKEVHL